MGRGAVKVVIVLFHILAMIALRAGQPKEPLLENRVSLVPQSEREAEQILLVADAQQAIFAPTICPRTRLIVRKRVPGRATGRVIFAHGSPLALAEIRPPAVPGLR